MLWFKALHIISVVAWFAGLFYLPRLFVYHKDAQDEISLQRFQMMEWRLYHAIMWPAAIATTVFGALVVMYNIPMYMSAIWFHAKMALVLILWIYHLSCGYFVNILKAPNLAPSSKFFRVYNEVPTLILIAIVFLVVLQPRL